MSDTNVTPLHPASPVRGGGMTSTERSRRHRAKRKAQRRAIPAVPESSVAAVVGGRYKAGKARLVQAARLCGTLVACVCDYCT
jgi:hypothetical protein